MPTKAASSRGRSRINATMNPGNSGFNETLETETEELIVRPGFLFLTERISMPNELFFQVDWTDLHRMFRGTIMDGTTPDFRDSRNRDRYRELLTEASSWTGVTTNQLREWITTGYRPPNFGGIPGVIAPIREKRRTIMVEDGDNFHVELAYGGEDKFMSTRTKTPTIPGVRVEASVIFSSATDSKVVAQYLIWISQVLHSLEMSGVDAQLLLDFPTWNCMNGPDSGKDPGTGTLYHHLVRVKRENEMADFASWSAMVSPAAMRNFGFSMMAMHADKIGKTTRPSLGRGTGLKEWKVEWNRERQVLKISNPYTQVYSFEEEKMTKQFRAAMAEMTAR